MAKITQHALLRTLQIHECSIRAAATHLGINIQLMYNFINKQNSAFKKQISAQKKKFKAKQKSRYINRFEQTTVLQLLQKHKCSIRDLAPYLNCKSYIIYNWIRLQDSDFIEAIKPYKSTHSRGGKARKARVKKPAIVPITAPPILPTTTLLPFGNSTVSV